MSDNTTKFTSYEKIIAKNIDKEYKWIARYINGNLCVFKKKPEKLKHTWKAQFDEDRRISFFKHMFSSIKWEDDEPTLIKDIYDPQILSDAEREYLKMVLKPFHDEVEYVEKFWEHFAEGECYSKEFLFIKVSDGQLSFPYFATGKMYAGMERDREYKLEELGITY